MKRTNQKDLSTIVLNWLKATSNKVHSSYIKEQLYTHPDYPALTSVIDLLDAGNMKYQAVQADTSCINEFNYPALVHIKEHGNEYLHIIPDAATWNLQKDILTNWSGITIFPEKNASWQNAENTIAIRKENQQKILFSVWTIFGLTLLAISVYFKPSLFYNLFGLLSSIGIVISLAAFITELGIQNSAIKQVCGAVNGGRCEQVLNSKLAKGILGITPADAALIYFSAQFLVYLFSVFYNPAFSFLPYIAIAGIALILGSIYSQAFLLKQWCALCLGIAGVLLLQAIVSVFLIGYFSINSFWIFTMAVIYCVIILIPLKRLIKNNVIAKPKLAELKRWKSNTDLFIGQWENQQEVNTDAWENDIILGNSNASLQITIACNPFCVPCAKVHEQVNNLLNRYSHSIKIVIRLLSNPNSANNKLTIAAKAILEKTIELNNKEQIAEMLHDWFYLMDLRKWKEKWSLSINPHDVTTLLDNNNKWFEENNIRYTPTILINGKEMPGMYDLSDIEMHLPNLKSHFEFANSSR